MKRKMTVLLSALMILSGCRTNGRQIDATYDTDVYRDYMTQNNKVESLNYLVTNNEMDLKLLGNLVDGLVETDRYGNLKPALAQDVGEAYENAKIWDFSIRGEVPWVDANGDETGYFVTADDFLCGLQYVLDQKNGSAFRNQVIALIENAKEYVDGSVSFDEVGIEAINDYTLRFTLKSSCAYFNTYLLNGGFYPVSRTLLEEVGSNFATSPETMWYNGAYYLKEYSDDNIVYEKNEEYWEVGQVSFESGSIQLVEDDAEALNLFESGDLSYAYVDDQFAEDNGPSIDSHMYMSREDAISYIYLFNFEATDENTKKAFANDAFRKAIFYGMNQNAAYLTKESDVAKKDSAQSENETLASTELNASVQSTLIPAGFVTKSDGQDYVTMGSLASFSSKSNFDSEKLVAYQQQAMAELSKSVAFPVEIRVPVCMDDSYEGNKFSRLIAAFDKTFVNFTIVGYTNKDKSESSQNNNLKYYQEILNGNEYDMLMVGISAEYGDPSTYLKELLSTSNMNKTYSHFNDKVYDSLYSAANQFLNSDERLMAFAECEAYLLDKAYIVPFSHGNLRYKVSSLNDYTMPNGTYGLARFKLKGVKATEQALTINEREEFKAAYEEAKNSGI